MVNRSPSYQAKRALSRVLVPFWRWRDPLDYPPRRSTPSRYPRRKFPPTEFPPTTYTMNPSDNLQRTMNLIMPLKDPSPFGRAVFIEKMSPAIEEMTVGLNSTGVVHFARFTLVQGSLCMFSVYDGDFANYIRDFIANMGNVFDDLMGFVKDPPAIPTAENVEEFIDWVMERDAWQMPATPTELAPNLRVLPRKLTLMLDEHQNAQFFAYSAYPGYSVAQVRHKLGVSW